jgi:hypothetical protein
MAPNSTVSTVYQWPSGTWVENIAVRANGQLVVIHYSAPEMYVVDPFASPPTAKLVARVDNATGIEGLAEVYPDVFAMMPFKGTDFSVWTVDLAGDTPKSTEVIANVPGAKALNGLTKLSDGVLLATDTKRGGVVRLDLKSNSASTLMTDPSMGFGINGIRARDNTIFYTNSLKGTLCSMPINHISGSSTGSARVITSSLGTGLDDLAIGQTEDQPTMVMQWLAGEVLAVDRDGSKKTAAKGLNWPTSAAWGKGDTLYVTTSGNPIGQSLKTFPGGGIYAIKPL